MAYVITTPCIGVKDTACVDACPTDAIHAYADSPQLYIDPATCIDCDACLPACPVAAIFPGNEVPEKETKFIQINSDFFKSFDKSKSFVYTRQKKEGEKKGSDVATSESSAGGAATTEIKWIEQPGWEVEWEKHKNDMHDRVEEQKRYGRVRAVYELADRYVIRFFLPEKTPIHPFVYKYALPTEMPSYQVTAELKENLVLIKGRISDPRISRLNGHANSFPDRFYVEYSFNQPVASVSVTPQNTHVVDVIVLKGESDAKAA